jgi:hypothetical protein
MIQKWPLMHASRRVTEKPLKETQAEVLVTKEGDNTQGSDLGINCARVLQEVLPQLNNGGVISHLLFQSKGSQLALRKKSKGGLVIARQYFAFLRCGSSLHDSETAAASLLLVARWVAANQKNARANPPAPANVGASAPLHPVDDVTDGKLVDGAHSRPDSKPIAYLRDQEHRVLGRFVAHPLGQVASFPGSLVPIFGVVDIRCNGHGTPFLGPYTLAQETAYAFCPKV